MIGYTKDDGGDTRRGMVMAQWVGWEMKMLIDIVKFNQLINMLIIDVRI